MKKVIKNQKKMKNTMYIVFGVFALALFGVTIINPSYASEWLIIDEALDAIVLYWEVETAKDEEVVEETQDEEENIPAVDNEWDENSKYLEDDGDDNNEDEENLDWEEVDNGENDENEDWNEWWKIEENDKTSETEEVDNQPKVQISETSIDDENHGVSDENFEKTDNEDLGNFGFIVKENNLSIYEEDEESWEDDIEIIWGNNHIIWNRTKWIITIYTWDFSYGVTIEDKNLGAENVWEIWLYYQYWINHWNSSDSETTKTLLEWNNSYIHNWYPYETLFIAMGNIRSWNNDYWRELRWWENDNSSNNWWLDILWETINYRKWPCNNEYHVPSIWERENLVNIRCESHDCWNLYTSSPINYHRKTWLWRIFYEELMFPFSQRRSDDWNLYESNRRLLTSTPFTTWRPVFKISDNSMEYWTDWMYDWLNIRCFKNEYVPYSLKVKYNPNWWAFSWMNKNEVKEYTYTADENWITPIYNIQIPNRESEDITQQSGWMFAWWYTKDWTNNDWWEEFDISNPQSTIAYAKWLPFNDLKLNFWWREIIIMDRNMWAEDVAEWTYYWDNNWHEDLTKLWYYYQWWNNYWFKNDWTIIHSWSDLVSNPEHLTNPWWPDNYYYSNKFIKRNNNPYRWNNEYNKNLWWWENFTNLDIDKQWPCPKWYHVPDALERQAVYNALVSDSHYCSSFWVDTWNCLSSILKLPFAGWRISYNGGVSNQGDLAFYLSSSLHPYWLDDPYIMYFKNNYISSKYSNYPTNAYSVRCFKNSYYKILTLSSDNWEEDKKYEIRWREPISLYTNELVKNWYIFLWRFYDDSEWIKVWDFDLIKQDTKIKALWNKNPQYLYLANWWLFRNQKLQRSTTFTIYKEISKSHNKDEKWNTYTNYNPYLDAKEVITITWANTLNISFPLRGNSSNIGLMFSRRSTDDFDFITIWTWKHLDYSWDNNQYEAYFWKESIKNIWNLPMPSINNIPWDTITFWFTTHEKYWGYWYYAIVTWLVYTDEEWDSLSSIQINEFPSRLWYSFSWRYETGATEPFDFTWTKINQDRTFYAKWNPHHYTIKFELNWWAWVVNDINAIYWEEISLPNVTREWYTFKWWQSDDWTLYNKTIPEWTWIATEDWVIVTLTAQWEKIQESSWNSSSWGWRKSTPAASEMNKPLENTAEIATINEHNSADEETDKSSNPEVGQVIAIDWWTQKTVAIKNTEIVATVRNTTHSSSLRFTKEENEAYSFAKSNWLTTTSSIEQAKMNTELTRIQMAKMLSNFAINVLWQEPDTEKWIVKFEDVTNKMDKQYDNAVTKAYQLWIMWQNVKNNEFRPNDTVTRAEFASSLSRLLYDTEEWEYKWTWKYYIPHVAKLYNEWIINKADPKIKEKRWYVMTMLMRTVK